MQDLVNQEDSTTKIVELHIFDQNIRVLFSQRGDKISFRYYKLDEIKASRTLTATSFQQKIVKDWREFCDSTIQDTDSPFTFLGLGDNKIPIWTVKSTDITNRRR